MEESEECAAIVGESEKVEGCGDFVRKSPEMLGFDESLKDLTLSGIESRNFRRGFQPRKIEKCVGHVDSAVGVHDGQKVE